MKNLTVGTQTINLKVENGKAFATSLDIAKAFDKRHKNIIQKIENLSGFDKFIDWLNIQPIYYDDKYGRKQKAYKVNRDIFLMVTLSLRGEKAEQYRFEFIQAFNLLEEEYFKTQNKLINENDKDLVIEHTLPFDPKNTISKVNGLKRDKLVRSYYRSKNGKELKLLDKAIANLKTSLFGYDEDMLIELIDRRNELIEQRNDFIDLIS